MSNKIIYIDIEGDTSSAKCRQYCSESNLYRDPNTRIWLIAFRVNNKTYQYGCKLPNKARLIDGIHSTGIYHEDSSNFTDDVVVSKCYGEFLTKIKKVIDHFTAKGYVFLFKGFKTDPYDRGALESAFNKEGIECDLTRVYADFELLGTNIWTPKTFEQKTHGWIDNQTFMHNAIKHNKEDVEVFQECVIKFINRGA